MNNYFCTYDIGLVAGLLSAGFQIDEMNKDDPRRIGFKFKQDEELSLAVDDYFLDKLNVSARMMYDNFKMIKNITYNTH